MEFKLDVDDLIGLSVSDVSLKISETSKRKFNELRFIDMLFDEQNEAIRHGIYLMFNDKSECVYVGKCSSTHFVDRLGSHLGMSPNYKHTFLSKLVESLELPKTFDGYVTAAKKIGDYSYMIINANGKGKEYIGMLEKIFMLILNPSLNNLPKKMNKLKSSGTDIFDINLYK